MKELTVVVPIRNEADNLAELTKRIHQTLSSNKIDYEIIFVDDNSTDETKELILKLSSKYKITYFLNTLLSNMRSTNKCYVSKTHTLASKCLNI